MDLDEKLVDNIKDNDEVKYMMRAKETIFDTRK
jgi:hypothetical protein